MASRTYSHYCAIARALDVLGERWTLLLLRELLSGPKRFTDLLEGLPGVGTGLLSSRLRELEREEVIARRKLPAPAASVVYELTDSGRRVEPVLLGLARWGMDRLGPPRADDAFRLRWAITAMSTLFDADAATGAKETYEFLIGDEQFHVRVDDGRVDVFDGPAAQPALRIRSDPETFLAALSSPKRWQPGVHAGLKVEGDPETLERCLRVFAPTVPTLAGRSLRAGGRRARRAVHQARHHTVR
jgi:DNA-binding HxlR family transcriptional regulator